jgi:Glycine-zipper domain
MPVTSNFNAFRVATFLGLATLCLCSIGCKKASQPNTETPAAQSPTAQAPAGAPGQPTSTAAQPGAPPAPTGPVPSFSAANKVGLYAYPGKGQSHDQQLVDELDCYNSGQQQTNINPDTPAPQPPSSADIQAAQAQAADAAPQQKGGRAKGAARGAVGGAVVGGVVGDAGTGAAVGATVGTVRGGRQQRKSNEAAKDQASAQAGSQVEQQYRNDKAAYDQHMNTFKRAFSACMEARGYSVK